MNEEAVDGWVQQYLGAWRSNDPEDVEALFTEDARYFTEPYKKPKRGRGEIVEDWLARKDNPGEWSFRYQILAVAEGLGFIQGETEYRGPVARSFANLWVVRLTDEGLCSEFTEWWMEVR